MDLSAPVERGRRAGALGIDEVARDGGDDLLGAHHRLAADDLHLLARGRAVECQGPTHHHAVHRAQHGAPSAVVDARWTTPERSSNATASARSIRKISLRMPEKMAGNWSSKKVQS
jgi:hypothetical protein